MKKIIAITALSLFVAGTAFAAASATGTATAGNKELKAGNGQSVARASKGVYWGWYTGTGGYALTTKHESGDKMYGTGYDSTKLYFKAATAIAAPADSNTAVAFPENTWTAM